MRSAATSGIGFHRTPTKISARPVGRASKLWNPYTEADETFTIPGGGPGYYRTPSLISCWSSAPFLHNNALGKFTGDPIRGRTHGGFQRRRAKAALAGETPWQGLDLAHFAGVPVHAAQRLPAPACSRRRSPTKIDPDGYFRIGHIPEGTPVNLLANINPEMPIAELAKLCLKVKQALIDIKLKGLDAARRRKN